MNKKTKITLITVSIILVAIFIFRFIYENSSTKTKDNKEPETENLSPKNNNPTEYVTRKFDPKIAGIEALDKKAEGYEWTVEKKELPASLPIIKLSNYKLDESKIGKILSNLNIKNPIKSFEINQLIMYSDGITESYVYIDKEKNSVSYHRGEGTVSNGNSRINLNSIKDDFIKTASLFLDSSKGISLETIDYKFFKTEYTLLLPSNMIEAEVIKVEGVLIYKGRKLYTSSGLVSVIAEYDPNGVLLTFKIQNPFLNIEEGDSLEVESWEEIIKKNKEDFLIFSVEGGDKYIRGMGNYELTGVEIYDMSLDYIYSAKLKTYLPMGLLKGRSNLSSGMAEIKLGLPITK
jgi:hypothetical protein